MKVLAVGGAGIVGTILRPALEDAHELYVFDQRKVEALDGRSLVGDVSDDEAVRCAVAGMDAIVYLATGVHPDKQIGVHDVDRAFDVNLRGAYRFMREGLEAGVRRFIYASSLSVYDDLYESGSYVDESVPPNAWRPYGLSKRLAEKLCEAGAMRYPNAMIIALRLLKPVAKERLQGVQARRADWPRYVTGPVDLRRLFLAALACSRPGAHVVQASSDVAGTWFANTSATALLGWHPIGE
jgi:UDP-glucose 4-epimerase